MRMRGIGLEQFEGVVSRRELNALGINRHIVRAQLAARRWRQFGAAIVLHNAAMTRSQQERAMLINCGPRSLLTSFTAAAPLGLQGWDRSDIHVLAPAGTRRPRLPGLVLHWAADWSRVDRHADRRLHRLNASLLVATNSFSSPRSACGILASAVQQRLTTAGQIAAALEPIPNLRHRRLLGLALADIGQGSQALSEIDLARICRRHRLPPPTRQAIRVERSGRRRYLDAEWRRPDGSVLAAEIDGAIHLSLVRWIDDQLRQNEMVLAGTDLLRFPSILLRTEEALVIDQLRRGLRL